MKEKKRKKKNLLVDLREDIVQYYLMNAGIAQSA
jgi:hypothetical protein